MDKELFEKLSQEEKLSWSNLCLQIENSQLKLFISQHNQEEFITRMKEKHSSSTLNDKEKENGNDK